MTGMILATEIGPTQHEADPAGNWSPQHTHSGGLHLAYDIGGPPRTACFLDFMRYRLRHVDGVWVFESVDRHFTSWKREGVALDVSAQFSTDTTYVFTHEQIGEGCRIVFDPMPDELTGP